MIAERRENSKVPDIFTININHWETSDFVLKAAYLCLQMVDLGLTVTAVNHGFPELNPFMRAPLTSLSQLLMIKLAVPLLISWFIPGKLLIPGIMLLCGIIGWNVKELLLLWF